MADPFRVAAPTIGRKAANGLDGYGRGAWTGRAVEDEGRMSRRRFLALSAAGLAVAGLGVGGARPAAAREETPRLGGVSRRFAYRGSEVLVEEAPEPRISIDGEDLYVIDSNGAYRAARFAYSPASSLDELAKRVVDNRAKIPGRI